MSASEVMVFDVETTGTDRRRDQVIELCVQFGLTDSARSRIWRIRPSVPISPGAQAVHGITLEELAGSPCFADVAGDIRRVFDGAQVLVGYNLEFDIGMLQAEFERVGQRPLDLGSKKIIDAFRLWQQCEPRSLQHAHLRFVGGAFAEAHSAAADVAATGRVLQSMIETFGLSGHDWEAIAEVCEPERATWIGPSRHLRWDAGGSPVLNFGKHAGKPIHSLARSDGGNYLRWVMGSDFPPHVREVCAKAFELAADEFIRWVRRSFGGVVPDMTAPAEGDGDGHLALGSRPA
jgi:DNA polymerase III subunit epsilon